MELRSGRRLESEPPPQPLGGCRPRRRADGGDGVDRISALPDDLLLQVLIRVRCTRAAALAGLLSRRWRGLWRHLPELSFREISPGALDAALSQVAGPALSRLEIELHTKHLLYPPVVSALLHAAARLAPAELVFTARGYCKDCETPIELPSFSRATSINLDMGCLHLAPPAMGGEFPVLERLSLCRGVFHLDALILRCPRLRVLEVYDWWWGMNVIKVHSPSIEELVVEGSSWLGGIDVVAPSLKRLASDISMDRDFSVSLSTPVLEDLSWSCSCDCRNVGIDEMWRLSSLNLWKEESTYILMLEMAASVVMQTLERNLMQEIAPLPDFSGLNLRLITRGHVFGAMVLNILGSCMAIRRLNLVIHHFASPECTTNCPCDQAPNWRRQNISLTALQEVEIQGFDGTLHEVDFLKLLFRIAPLLKRMTVTLSPRVRPNNRGCKKIYYIFKANPSVKCSVYRCYGEQILYA